MKIVTVEQMRSIEKSADAAGLTYQEMMLHAGKGIASWIIENTPRNQSVIGLVGSGNNGGDTLIALTRISQLGIRTIAFLAKESHNDPLVGDYRESGGMVVNISDNMHTAYLQATLKPGVVLLDGILGTGLQLPLRGVLSEVMGSIHDLIKTCPDVLTIAIDCPSGMDCDTGEVSDRTIHANHTLSMAAIKQGLLRPPGSAYTGRLHVIDIGINDIEDYISATLPEMIDRDFVKDLLPLRPASGYKGTFGTSMVVAGSAPFTGAAYLTGKAAYRSGCGLVDMASLKSVQMSLSSRLIEAVWTILPEKEGGFDVKGINLLREKLKNIESLVIGPGWGLSAQNEVFLDELIGAVPDNLPLLIDADGLKLLSGLVNWWDRLPAQSILTPHPGEMAVLSGLKISEIQTDRWEVAREYAQRWGVVLVLKGAMTVIATPTGEVYVNEISEPALATAGSGDVLSGIIGGLLAQGVSAVQAGILGVWLHGQAGVIARKQLGSNISVTALNILDSISNAFLSVLNSKD